MLHARALGVPSPVAIVVPPADSHDAVEPNHFISSNDLLYPCIHESTHSQSAYRLCTVRTVYQ